MKLITLITAMLIGCGSRQSGPPVSTNQVYLYSAYELCGDPSDCPLKEEDFRFAGTVNSDKGKIWYWSFASPSANETLWAWCEPYENGYAIGGFLDEEPKFGSYVTIEDDQMTPLAKAVYEKDMKAVTDLLKQGHDPNASKYAALLWCILNDDEEMTTLLLSHGADVNARVFKETQSTPLMLAAQHNSAKLVQLLLECGADQTLMDSYGWTARQKAEHLGHVDLYEFLENTEPESQERLLTIAAQKNDTHTISALLDEGVAVHGAFIGGLDALMWSASKANMEALNLLIDHGADIYRVNDQGLSAFEWANLEGQLDVLRLLKELDKGKRNLYQHIDTETTFRDKLKSYPNRQ